MKRQRTKRKGRKVMKIETRFNVDDEVYFMHDNRVAIGNVATIQVYTHKPLGNEIVISVKYYLKGCSVQSNGYIEEELFASKQELLNSL